MQSSLRHWTRLAGPRPAPRPAPRKGICLQPTPDPIQITQHPSTSPFSQSKLPELFFDKLWLPQVGHIAPRRRHHHHPEAAVCHHCSCDELDYEPRADAGQKWSGQIKAIVWADRFIFERELQKLRAWNGWFGRNWGGLGEVGSFKWGEKFVKSIETSWPATNHQSQNWPISCWQASHF